VSPPSSRIGYCRYLDKNYQEYFEAPNNPKLDGLNQLTLSCWINPPTSTDVYYGLICQVNHYMEFVYCLMTGPADHWGYPGSPTWTHGNGLSTKFAMIPNLSDSLMYLSTMDAGPNEIAWNNSWYFYQARWDGATMNTSVNANRTPVGDVLLSAPMPHSNGPLWIGDYSWPGQWGADPVSWATLNGMIDEVRISNVVRSDDWQKLDYENQKPSQTLIEFGPRAARPNAARKLR
jgi:hypothetical protein